MLQKNVVNKTSSSATDTLYTVYCIVTLKQEVQPEDGLYRGQNM